MGTVKFNFSIDGNYGFHLFQYLKDEQKKLINWRRLEAYIREFLSKKAGENCLINVRNYYIGNSYKLDDKDTKEGIDRKDYQNSLTMANFQPYLIQKQGQKEAGVDIRLAIEAIKHMNDEGVRYFVLVSGDGDFCTLLDELHDVGKEVLLIQGTIPETFDRKGTYTSTVLTSLADYKIDLFELSETHPEIFDYFENLSYASPATSRKPMGLPPVPPPPPQRPVIARTIPERTTFEIPKTTIPTFKQTLDEILPKETLPALTPAIMLQAVKGVKAERERQKGVPLKSVFLADVGLKLSDMGYKTPPEGLKEYLKKYPDLFYVGINKQTNHPIVYLKEDAPFDEGTTFDAMPRFKAHQDMTSIDETRQSIGSILAGKEGKLFEPSKQDDELFI